MSREITIPCDLQIPSRYISGIAQTYDFPANMLGTRWYASLDSPDISEETDNWLKKSQPEDNILIAQVVSSLVAPVYVWDSILNDGSLRVQQLTAVIPDYDGVIPPLLIWKDTSGDLVNIKRVEDIRTLVNLCDDTILPHSGPGSTTGLWIMLPIDAFLCLLRVADCVHLSHFQALITHTPPKKTITIDDICRFFSDILYLRDTRWAFPAGLSTCTSTPDGWNDERMNQALSHLVHAGLFEKHESGNEISLSPEGKVVINLFSPNVLRIISQESSRNAESSVINSAHWIIWWEGGTATVQFGKMTPSKVLIASADMDSLRSYHQELINPVEHERTISVYPSLTKS
ncbi:MAG: hypothetical protein NTV68_14675 [Methanomicrobiales archaeon]|nr:hypothetical protein [Methanomicrobiales archaeon]